MAHTIKWVGEDKMIEFDGHRQDPASPADQPILRNTMTTIAKKYKNPQMQRAFDGVLSAARAHDKALFSEDGGMRRGSSQACAFWGGYLGKKIHTVQPGSLASAAYAAGQQFKKESAP